MPRYVSGSSLLVSLMLLSGIGVMLFISRDLWLRNERISQHYYQTHLSEKMSLLAYHPLDREKMCQTHQTETVVFRSGDFRFSFHCRFHSIFLQPKPTKEKYIFVEDINAWLDMEKYRSEIIQIASLDELPESSEESPKIVQTTQAIEGRLTKPFYGIVITDHLFNFTDKRIYGTIYSSYKENDPNRRNHSYKKTVIQNIERDYSYWHYLPHSNSILNDESIN